MSQTKCDCNCHKCYTNTNNLDLQSQVEELKSKLRNSVNAITEKELKFNDIYESYELQSKKFQEELKLSREKYDKLFDLNRRLEKTNSNLEDKLLAIVERKETEISALKADLSLTQSKLIQAKLIMNDLEHEKQRYKQDCELAVHLLQCEPAKFVSHSFNTLPLNLKERLKSQLPSDEIYRLEDAAHMEEIALKENEKMNTLTKIPTFQATAAAAIMYQMQTNMLLKEKRKLNDISNGPFSSMRKSSDYGETVEASNDPSKVSSALIGELLMRSEAVSERARLFPFMCSKCKGDVHVHDTSTQTNEAVTYKPSESAFCKSKSVANNLNSDSSVQVYDVNECKKQAFLSSSDVWASHKHHRTSSYGNGKMTFENI